MSNRDNLHWNLLPCSYGLVCGLNYAAVSARYEQRIILAPRISPAFVFLISRVAFAVKAIAVLYVIRLILIDKAKHAS